MEPWQIIVLLGAVILVAAFLMPRKQQPSGQGGTLHNMEIALEQFMENMEKDNGELMQLLADSGKAAAEREQRYESRISMLEKTCAQLEQQLHTIGSSNSGVLAPAAASVQGQAAYQQADAVAAPAEEAEEAAASSSIQSRYASLLELHHNGKSIEAIARRLEMNKGEVQLILQLAKQEEAARV